MHTFKKFEFIRYQLKTLIEAPSVNDLSDEDEENILVAERRQYRMLERIDMEKWDDQNFFQRFRLNKSTVAKVLQIIQPDLGYPLERSRYIRPIVQLLIALRFYAVGSMQRSVADFTGVSIASVCNLLPKVTEAIAKNRLSFIKMPQTIEEMNTASDGFFKFARFPRTIGAIGCTHIKIQSPGGNSAENYRNTKGWYSINVQAVCSANMKILNIVARWPGASPDQTIFNNSLIKMKLERGNFKDFFIIGDSGYRNTRYMATPFVNPDSELKNIYNESHIRTRNVIDQTFGAMKRRFPVLAMGMRLKLTKSKSIIVACAVLHNIAIDENENIPPTELEGFDEIMEATNIPNVHITTEPNEENNARDFLINNYFRQ